MSQLRISGQDVGNVSVTEIVALARAQIGLAWSTTGCAMFAVGIADAAGASYAGDSSGSMYAHYERLTIPDTIAAVTPRAGNYQLNGFTDNASGVWNTVKFNAGLSEWNSMKAALRPGDIVRLWGTSEAYNQTSKVHSFIVASVAGGKITVVDNTGSGGTIREHDLTDYASGAVSGLYSAYVSHLKTVNMTSTTLNDILLGTETSDSFFAGSGDDRVFGRGGNDSIYGETGNDVLRGGAGDDRISGDGGMDKLIGGKGSDRFVFVTGDSGTGTSRDVIGDFTPGADKVDLALIDANRLTSSVNDAFTFIGTSNFSGGGHAGQLRMNGGIIYGDTDGNGVADFEIQVLGSNQSLNTLSSTDFYL